LLPGHAASQDIASAAAAEVPDDPRLKLEYLEIVDPETMQPITSISSAPVLVAGALWVGATRLIDNLLCSPSKEGIRETP